MAAKKTTPPLKNNVVVTHKTDQHYTPMKPTDTPENRYSDQEMPSVYKK